MKEQIEKGLQPEICESCGETFGCGAKLEGCWCSDVELDREILAGLTAKFDKCLCKNCLEIRQEETLDETT